MYNFISFWGINMDSTTIDTPNNKLTLINDDSVQEQKFRETFFEEFRVNNLKQNTQGKIMFVLFGILDYFANDDPTEILTLRLAIAAPIVIALLAYTYNTQNRTTIELITSINFIVFCIVHLLFLQYVEGELYMLYCVGYIMITIHVASCIKLRLVNLYILLATSTILFTATNAYVAFYSEKPVILITLIVVYLATVSMLLKVAYYRENDYRKTLSLITQLNETITIDALTGIKNRKFFDTTLEAEINRAKRSQTELSLLMIDIDFFKQYNDTYGHVAGDECLQAVAKCIDSIPSRGGEFVARYGGEEFAVILPNINQLDANLVACMIIDAVSDLEIEHSHSAIDVVTASIGCATLCAEHNYNAKNLVQAADVALYVAKGNGRNRFESI